MAHLSLVLAMKPILSIGQQAIKFNGNTYLFSPSFKNIANIGEPSDIITIFNLMTSQDADPVATCGYSNDIMMACCVGDLPDGLLWDVASSWGGDRVVMKRGKVSLSAQIIMAVDLLYMGIIGKPGRLKERGTSKPMTEFNASEYVSIAVSQLGMTPANAWDMTMIDFQRAMEVRHPELFAPRDLPTKSELAKMNSEADAAIKRLNAKRGIK